jgi:hypothetical protein
MTSDERDPAGHHLIEPTFSLKFPLDHQTHVEFRVSGRRALLTHGELEHLRDAFDVWLKLLPCEPREDQPEAEPAKQGTASGKAPQRRRR